MRILVVSNLFPPAFLGGYEIGASWVCEELQRQGHEILLWSASCVADGRASGFRMLEQPRDTRYRWLPSGPALYGFDVLGGLLLRGYDAKYDPIRDLLHDFLRDYATNREARRQAITSFAPERVLIFNPACILDPVFAELACLPALATVPRVALISDDWPLVWQSSHPLVYFWREWHALQLRSQASAAADESLLAKLGNWVAAQGLFSFSAPADYTHACFTSAHLQAKCRPATLRGAASQVVHWGLPGAADFPRRRASEDSTRPLRIAFCGQIQPHKGLIRILRALRHTRRACSLMVIGDDTTDYASFCRAYAQEHGLAGRVEFTGKLPASQVAPLLAGGSDLLLLPSLHGGRQGFEEPFSIVLLQAMACGLAVGASRSGGSVEAFIEEESGVFIDPDQPEQIATVLDRLDADRALVDRLGAAARKRIEQEFTIEGMVRRLLAAADIPAAGAPPVIYAVRNATIDPANSGCVRVTRRLGRLLEGRAPVVCATWHEDNGTLHQLRADQAEVLSRFNGPRHGLGLRPGTALDAEPVLAARHAGGWVLLPEIMPAAACRAVRARARAEGRRVAAIFYDSIALLQPEFCNEEIRNNHAAYMEALAECDLVIPISHFSERCLREFWTERRVTPTRVETVLLPGEFSGGRLATGTPPPLDGVARVLCVSTLEPRKNHLRLLRALDLLPELCPGIRFELNLVGNGYAGAQEIARTVEAAAARDDRVRWWRVVDDQRLHEMYADAHFTIYPSLIEGFGLPILESIWHERPCICSDQGVMFELAREGGCLATNVRDERCLAQALAMLATDDAFRRRLTEEAARRPLKTWDEYCDQVLDCLHFFRP